MLGLSADRSGAGAGGGLHRAGVRAVIRPPAGKEPQVPQLPGYLQYPAGPQGQGKRRNVLLLLLLLLLAAAGLLGWKFRPRCLVAVPNTLTGPVGSRFEVKVMKAGLFSKEDVTGHAVGIVLDPAVARYDQMTGTARLVGPGEPRSRSKWAT